ncbi:MAG: methyltransferase domain-containing protein [Bacilli bacterium]|nr:methyltransferase domain-containing protein [Bacilli bacterium]
MNKGYLILVGGSSGSGKTLLINHIIENYNNYVRPISYTTREKRKDENNNEYVFISKEQFSIFKELNYLYNIDFVYENYYAMDKNSIDYYINRGYNVIKEIHPENQKKIKNEGTYNCIRILIESNITTKAERKEDIEYYKVLSKNEFDIIVNNCNSENISTIAKYVIHKIENVLKYYDVFPSGGEIDVVNNNGYNKIAKYFDDEKRITTKNFHDMSYSFFKNIIESNLLNNKSVLEIGSGRGWLRNNFTWNKTTSYTSVDISEEMNNMIPVEKTTTKSARNLPFSCESFDAVICSLADPFFYPEAISEIFRVLKQKGLLIFSIPTKEWSSSIRMDDIYTYFLLPDGQLAKVYSFTFFENELKSILKSVGFEIELFLKIGINNLISKDISPVIKDAINNTMNNELPIIFCVKCYKE